MKKTPVTLSSMIENKRDKNAVSCIISERWLKFDKESISIGAGETFFISVMTDVSGQPKKICRLAVTKEEILKALENVKLK